MKWWDLIVVAALAVMAVALALAAPGPANIIVGAAALVGILLAYVLLGRGLLARADTDEERPRLSLVFLGIIGLLAAVGVAAEPNLASLQALLYPMLWMLSPRYSRAVIGSAVLAALIGVGLWVGLGGVGLETAAAANIAFGVQSLSFAFSVALGTWIGRIASEGTAAKLLVAELTLAQRDVAALSEEAGAASERERLSRELHDTLTQTLTGLVMLAERAGVELREGWPAAEMPVTGTGPRGSSPAASSIALIERTARDALGEARALVASTHPLGDRGLAESLARVAARAQDETGIAVTVHSAEYELPREIEVVLLRCAQEGLSNVRKHANAASARLRLAASNDSVMLTLLDDGVGPAAARTGERAEAGAGGRPEAGVGKRAGFGLAGMRERVALVGGAVAFGPAPGGGALLRVTLPLAGQTTEPARAQAQTQTQPGPDEESAR